MLFCCSERNVPKQIIPVMLLYCSDGIVVAMATGWGKWFSFIFLSESVTALMFPKVLFFQVKTCLSTIWLWLPPFDPRCPTVLLKRDTACVFGIFVSFDKCICVLPFVYLNIYLMTLAFSISTPDDLLQLSVSFEIKASYVMLLSPSRWHMCGGTHFSVSVSF